MGGCLGEPWLSRLAASFGGAPSGPTKALPLCEIIFRVGQVGQGQGHSLVETGFERFVEALRARLHKGMSLGETIFRGGQVGQSQGHSLVETGFERLVEA